MSEADTGTREAHSPIIGIALIDAATNCSRDGGIAILTLRSGVQIEGELQKPKTGDYTAHVLNRMGGWATVLTAEIVAVETRRV